MYRTIETRIWQDRAVRRLGAHAKLLFVYLITNRWAHLVGIYPIHRAIINEELGLTSRQTSVAIRELVEANLIEVDPEIDLVLVRRMFWYQGRGQKHWVSAARQLEGLDPGPLPALFLDLYPEVLPYVAEDYVARLPEPEAPSTKPAPSKPTKPKPKTVTDKELRGVWERHIQARQRYFERKNGKAPPSLPDLTPELRRMIREAIHRHGAKKATDAGVGIFYSDFHTGTNDNGTEHLAAHLCWRITRDLNNVEKFAALTRDMETRYGD